MLEMVHVFAHIFYFHTHFNTWLTSQIATWDAWYSITLSTSFLHSVQTNPKFAIHQKFANSFIWTLCSYGFNFLQKGMQNIWVDYYIRIILNFAICILSNKACLPNTLSDYTQLGMLILPSRKSTNNNSVYDYNLCCKRPQWLSVSFFDIMSSL